MYSSVPSIELEAIPGFFPPRPRSPLSPLGLSPLGLFLSGGVTTGGLSFGGRFWSRFWAEAVKDSATINANPNAIFLKIFIRVLLSLSSIFHASGEEGKCVDCLSSNPGARDSLLDAASMIIVGKLCSSERKFFTKLYVFRYCHTKS